MALIGGNPTLLPWKQKITKKTKTKQQQQQQQKQKQRNSWEGGHPYTTKVLFLYIIIIIVQTSKQVLTDLQI